MSRGWNASMTRNFLTTFPKPASAVSLSANTCTGPHAQGVVSVVALPPAKF